MPGWAKGTSIRLKSTMGVPGTSNRPSRSQGSIRDKLRTSLRKIHYICNTYVETKDRRIWQTGLKVASYSNTPQHWKHKSEPNERLYQRITHVPAPDQFWVTNTTYIRTTKGSYISRWLSICFPDVPLVGRCRVGPTPTCRCKPCSRPTETARRLAN